MSDIIHRMCFEVPLINSLGYGLIHILDSNFCSEENTLGGSLLYTIFKQISKNPFELDAIEGYSESDVLISPILGYQSPEKIKNVRVRKLGMVEYDFLEESLPIFRQNVRVMDPLSFEYNNLQHWGIVKPNQYGITTAEYEETKHLPLWTNFSFDMIRLIMSIQLLMENDSDIESILGINELKSRGRKLTRSEEGKLVAYNYCKNTAPYYLIPKEIRGKLDL